MTALQWLIELPKTKLFKKYLRSYLKVGILPIIILAFISLGLIFYTNLKNSEITLQSILTERLQVINVYMKDKMQEANTIVNDPKMEKFVKDMREAYKKGIKSEYYKKVWKSNEESIINMVDDNGFYDGLLIDTNGDIIATRLHGSDLGQNVLKDTLNNEQLSSAFLKTVNTGKTAVSNCNYYGPSKKYAMFITVPIKEKGKITSVGALQLKNEDINFLTQGNVEFGKSIEVVAGIKDGNGVLFLNNLKQDKKAVFVKTITIGEKRGAPIQKAVNGKSGHGILNDYFGVKVIAAWDYIPELQWGIVVKKNLNEVLSPVIQFALIFLLFGIVVLLYTIIRAVRNSELISKPIIELVNATKEGVKGNFSEKVNIESDDEIGEMADNYNELAKKIQSQLKELQESEEKYKATFEHASVGVVQASLQGIISRVNEEFCRITGRTKSELEGKPFGNFTHQDDVKNDYEMINKIVELKIDCYKKEKRYIKKDNSEVWVNVNVAPMFERGIMSGFVVVVEDISKRLAIQANLAESEERFRMLFEQAAVGIVEIDFDMNFIRANNKFCDITGYTAEELKNKTYKEITHDEDKNIDDAEAAELFSKKIRQFSKEKRYIKKDGESIWVNVTVSLCYNTEGTPKYIVGIAEDINEKKKAQNVLEVTLDELKRSNADLEQFAYISSHDLQEPLRSIAGYLQLIDRKYRSKLDKEADEYINSTIAAAERMKDIINDVLQYSKISKKAEPFSDVDVNEAVSQACMNLKGSIDANDATIKYSNLPVILGDFSQISRLFQNLIGNSIKFRKAENPVIEITSRENAKDFIFTVKDNGIGIDPEFNEKIFAIFQRLHSRREYPGTGIGLAVSKKIIERHGGKIWLESALDKGTEFYFTFPKRRL